MHRILVIAEHAHGVLKTCTGAATTFAAQLCAAEQGDFDIAILGADIHGVAAAAAHLGAKEVLVADHPNLREPLADRYAAVIAAIVRQRGATMVVGANSTFTKDILPRVAGLLDAGMLSDVLGFTTEANGLVFRRAMYAGNLLATVRLTRAIRVLTVRGSAFKAQQATAVSPITPVSIDAASLPAVMTFVSREERSAGRPDATEARVIVSGGRALRNADDFERLVGGLADTLGAAVGSSRALVDSGITPNSLQIGQTGKVVAPDVYIAVGISGAIQHLAGMKDAKIVVAINKDPDAPIFEVADYGLVGDVYQVVPELTSRLSRR